MTTLRLGVRVFGLSQRQAELLNHRQIPGKTDEVLQRFVRDLASEHRSRPYAPRLPNQRYIRTGRFGRSWKSGRIANNKHYIDNTAKARGQFYGRYVVGDSRGRDQASIHQGRWWVFREDLDQRIPDLVDDLEKTVEEAVS